MAPKRCERGVGPRVSVLDAASARMHTRTRSLFGMSPIPDSRSLARSLARRRHTHTFMLGPYTLSTPLPQSIWDVAWHPSRTILASCGHSGKVMIWAKHYAENYSAFAPNFKELEENEEYLEREDEVGSPHAQAPTCASTQQPTHSDMSVTSDASRHCGVWQSVH